MEGGRPGTAARTGGSLLNKSDVVLAREAAEFFQERVNHASDPRLRQAFELESHRWRRVLRAAGVALALAVDAPRQEALPLDEPAVGAELRLVGGSEVRSRLVGRHGRSELGRQ